MVAALPHQCVVSYALLVDVVLAVDHLQVIGSHELGRCFIRRWCCPIQGNLRRHGPSALLWAHQHPGYIDTLHRQRSGTDVGIRGARHRLLRVARTQR